MEKVFNSTELDLLHTLCENELSDLTSRLVEGNELPSTRIGIQADIQTLHNILDEFFTKA